MSPSSDACSHPADCVASVTTPRQCAPEHDSGLDRDRAAERVADDDEPARAGAAREIGRGGDVVDAAREVVGFAVADAHRRDSVRVGELAAERVVEAVGGTEQAAHPAATRHDDVARVAWTVPEHGEQPVQRVDLEVREPGRDLDFLDRERLEQFEGRTRFVLAHNIDFSSARVCARSSRDPKMDATYSVTPASASARTCFSTVASSPTIATSAGPSAPSRSSIARYDGRKP